MDDKHFNIFSLHHLLGQENHLGCSSNDSRNVMALSFSCSLVKESSTFEGDLPLGDYSLSRLPILMYSSKRSLFINTFMISFSSMQSSVFWSWPLWKRKYSVLSVLYDFMMGKGFLTPPLWSSVFTHSW